MADKKIAKLFGSEERVFGFDNERKCTVVTYGGNGFSSKFTIQFVIETQLKYQ